MQDTCVCARALNYKTVVVGIKGVQFRALEGLLEGYPITVREVSPEKLLRLGRLDGLVVLTRFVNHKHSNHAKRIAPERVVWVGHGAAAAVADAIIAFYGLWN